MEDLIILYSGGADSRLLLELSLKMRKNPYCVLIDYEQKHIKELEYARKQLDLKNIKYQTVSLTNLKVDSGLTGNNKEMKYEGVHEMHVPARNMMFVSIAASISENKGINLIWYGANGEDFKDQFIDCIQPWIGKMNELLKVNSTIPIMLEAPLIGFSKDRILELSEYFGIKQDEVFSGYGE